MPVEPTYLGTVEDVRGASISVVLASETAAGLNFISGVAYRIGQVGAFVRIPIGYIDLFGIVTQVGAGAVPEKLAAIEMHGHRWMTVELIGEAERGSDFQRGLSMSPAVGDAVHLVIVGDLARIYGRPHDNPSYVKIGRLASADSIPALVNIDKLITRHCAVLGATGSGKSTTVASLLRSLSERSRYPSARIVVLDVHGEYANALKGRSSVFRVNANSALGEKGLYLPYWAMSLDELLPVLFGGNLDERSAGVVRELIMNYKKEAAAALSPTPIRDDAITSDTPIPFSVHKLWLELWKLVRGMHDNNDGQSEKTLAYELDPEGKPIQPGDADAVIPPRFLAENKDKKLGPVVFYANDKSRNILSGRALDSLTSRLRDPRLSFLLRPGPWAPNEQHKPEAELDKLLHEWLGGKHPVVILDLSGIPISILNDLIGALLRIIYDALFWARNLSEGGKERPLLLVLEEAHLYLQKGQDGKTTTASSAVRRIAKEGRKYGIGAMIVSQRPSEVDETILSQCGTIVALRMSNESDRGQVTGTVTDSLKGLLSSLPILRTGEAVVVGEAVHLPMRALIQPPPLGERPDSRDPVIFGGKFAEGAGEPSRQGGWDQPRERNYDQDYQDMVEVWRLQKSKPNRTIEEKAPQRRKEKP